MGSPKKPSDARAGQGGQAAHFEASLQKMSDAISGRSPGGGTARPAAITPKQTLGNTTPAPAGGGQRRKRLPGKGASLIPAQQQSSGVTRQGNSTLG